MNLTVKTVATGAVAHWEHLAPVLTVPQSENDYERLVAVLDEVLDAGGKAAKPYAPRIPGSVS